MRHHPSIGDAVGYAMAHNARLAADHPNADSQEQHMTDQTAPCRSTRHCATHGFCHRCTPDLTVASKYLVKAISAARIDDERKGAVYAQLAAAIRDAARQASGQQPDSEPNVADATAMLHRMHADAGLPAPAAGLSDTQPANDEARTARTQLAELIGYDAHERDAEYEKHVDALIAASLHEAARRMENAGHDDDAVAFLDLLATRQTVEEDETR